SSGTRLPGRPLIGRRPSERHPGSSACVSPSQFGVASPILPRLCEPEDPECDGRSTEDPGTPSGPGALVETNNQRRKEGRPPSPAIAASPVSAPGLVMETTEAKTTPRPNSSINPPPSPSMSCQSQLRTRASPTAIVPQLSQRPLRIACHLPATRPPLPSAWRPLR